MNFLDRLTFRAKVFLSPAFALILFLVFGVMCRWMLDAQEQRINIDLAGQLQVQQSVQEGERKLAEAHIIIYRALSAAHTNAKPEVLADALATRKRLAGDARTSLVDGIRDGALDDAGRGLRATAIAGLGEYEKSAKDVVDGMDIDINLADMSMQAADVKFATVARQLADFNLQQKKLTEDVRKSIAAAERQTLLALVVALVAAMLLTMGSATIFSGAVIRQVNVLANAMKRCADGDLKVEIVTKGKDQIAELFVNLAKMRDSLFERMEADRKAAAETLRIKNALDKCSTSVMLANADGAIQYMNESQIALLTRAEADIGATISGFNVSALGGKRFDMFFKDAARVNSLLKDLRGAHSEEIALGAHTFHLVLNPIFSDEGERLGTVVEWKERTLEIAVEAEVAALVNAANQGDFTQRIPVEGKENFFKLLADGMNSLMETSSVGLNEVERVLGALARGDLTERITNDYAGTFGQLKDDANQTAEKLTEIVGQLKDAVESINTASKEIASGNTDLSSRTEEQASSLEETAASMEELTSTVKQNADNARQANQLAIGASDIAVKGGAVVNEVVGTMSSINEASKKIVDIISVIDSIAFQTNILALNAAVEAARAGEQGRGFAVVANEVRNLAHRSATAAKDIKALIGDSVEKVGVGAKLVDDAGKTMEEIVTSIKRVTDIMAEIASASVEQSSGIEQVNQAITQMDEVTQQNAALVEQAAAAAESLEEQAQVLAEAVGVFKLDATPTARADGQRNAARHASVIRPESVSRLSKRAKPAAIVPLARTKVSGGNEEWAEF
ncbi:MAG: methyl-accepting chemotaxis protein [Usitatibacteraceae bacterium]